MPLGSQNADAWPQARQNDFTAHWRVIAHQPNTASGFSGTVFERLDPQPGESKFVVAMRGTEGNVGSQIFPDLLEADVADLVANGLAWTQILDMYNWWQQVTASPGAHYQEAFAVQGPAVIGASIIETDGSSLVGWQIAFRESTAVGLGAIPEGSTLDVTGHSLGARSYRGETLSFVEKVLLRSI